LQDFFVIFVTEICLQFKGKAKVNFEKYHGSSKITRRRSSIGQADYKAEEVYLDEEIVLDGIRKGIEQNLKQTSPQANYYEI
jgi:hypothetical protein